MRQQSDRHVLTVLVLITTVGCGSHHDPGTVDGSGDGEDASVPAHAQVSAGCTHTCAVTRSGAAYCWGNGESGRLGNAGVVDAPLPVAVGGNLSFRKVSAGNEHTCGLTTLGTIYCWGEGDFGRLGTGMTEDALMPASVDTATYVDISAGGLHSCGVTANHEARCWGDARFGHLGNGDPVLEHDAPVAVSGGAAFRSISAGGNHTCAVTVANELDCWGLDIHGQIGGGATDACEGMTCAYSPAQVGTGTWESASAGAGHSCAIARDGTVSCWGYGADGRTGTGDENDHTIPVALSGQSADQVAAGGGHTCSVAGTTARCWGDNIDGQVGDGTMGNGTDRNVPTVVIGGLAFASISTGCAHSCGVTMDDKIYCWGSGYRGQLGVTSTGTTCATFGSTSYPCSATPQLVLDGSI